ncbi:hypothetical protein DSECCO2_653230 [anaerobic digester metagenome]
MLDQVADAVSPERVDPPDAKSLGEVQVPLGQDVVALGRGALEVAHEEEDRHPILFAAIDLVVDQVGDALFVDDHLRREVDRGYLRYLLAAEFIDEVVGYKFPDVPDAGQALDQDRSAAGVIAKEGHDDVFHRRITLL